MRPSGRARLLTKDVALIGLICFGQRNAAASTTRATRAPLPAKVTGKPLRNKSVRLSTQRTIPLQCRTPHWPYHQGMNPRHRNSRRSSRPSKKLLPIVHGKLARSSTPVPMGTRRTACRSHRRLTRASQPGTCQSGRSNRHTRQWCTSGCRRIQAATQQRERPFAWARPDTTLPEQTRIRPMRTRSQARGKNARSHELPPLEAHGLSACAGGQCRTTKFS